MPTLLDRGTQRLCRLVACVLLLGAAVASASCDKKYPTDPISFGFDPLGLTAVTFGVQSSTVFAQPVGKRSIELGGQRTLTNPRGIRLRHAEHASNRPRGNTETCADASHRCV